MVELAARKTGHERRDASVRLVSWFALGLVLTTVIIYFVSGGLYKLFKSQHPSTDAPSRIEFHPHMIAPAPQLQTNPQADFARFSVAENKLLRSYGWIDKEAGIVRIPIERAMDLIAERGLPTRGQGTKDSSGITPEQMQRQKAAATAVTKSNSEK